MLSTLDRTAVWHAFTQMRHYVPLIIERAQGCVLVDIEGREYLDGVSSLWCNVHGHRHPKLDAALQDQLGRVAHVTSLGMGNVPATELAQRLIQLAPEDLEHVFYSSDGACAVEAALKMAFQYWRQLSPPNLRKTKYVALHDAYHGDTLGSVSVGGVDRFHELFRPLLFDVIRVPAPDCYRLPEGVATESACGYYLQVLERTLAEHHETIAALVIEPLVQGAAGMLVHPPGFLRGVRELTERYHVLMIADEIAVGFGRTGRMFACEHEDVSPDLMCLGKGLTGGYLPMSATLATHEIWQAFLGEPHEGRQFSHGHTYAGNPLAAAVALASLDVFNEEQVFERLVAKCNRLAEHLAGIASLPHVGNVRQCGLIAAVELVADRESKKGYSAIERMGYRVCDHTTQHGVWLRPLGDVIVIMPPLAITIEQLDRIGHAVEQAIVEICGD